MAKRENTSYRFNLVDFLIVLLLIFAICTLVFVMLGNDILDITEEKVEISYVLSVDKEYDNVFSVGDEIFTKKGKNSGIVSGKDYDTDGSVLLVISALAYEADGDLFIKGQCLSVGHEFTISMLGEFISAECKQIVRLEG